MVALTAGRSSGPARSILIQPFYPALDGLRGIAILLVVSIHFGVRVWSTPLLRWGWIGVDLFFVLSGFLITGILYDSLPKAGFFRNFYTRRALRIFPLYYGFWLLLFLLTPMFHFQWNVYALSTVVYLGNFFDVGTAHRSAMILPYTSFFHPPMQQRIAFSHFWSLCVEEQFYLVWPAVVFLLRSRKALLRVSVGCIALVPCVRAAVVHFHPSVLANGSLYSNTFARVDTLLMGAALALWLRGPALELATLRRCSTAVAIGAPVLLAALSFGRPGYAFYSFSVPLVASLGYTLVGLTCTAVLVLAICPGSMLRKPLQWKPLAGIGRISYGIYFIHSFLADFLAGQVPWMARHHVATISPVFGFLLSVALAKLSFRYVESPFLALKERFAARPGAIADPPPAGTPLHYERPLRALPEGFRAHADLH